MKIINKSGKQAALAAVLVLGSGGWLSAQTSQEKIGRLQDGVGSEQGDKTAETVTNSQAAPVMQMNKCSALIGTTVKNQQGEELGKIRDFVIDFSSGRVAYAVLGSGTGLFSAQKLHAVPLRAFQPDPAGTSLILNADKSKLDRAEGLAKDNWPSVTTATFGAEPFWKDGQGTPSTPEARDLIPQSTKDKQDQENKDNTIEPKKSEPQPEPQPR